MKQIDQDPRDYRAEPVKGEPVFVPGSGKRVATHAAVFIGLTIITLPLYLVVTWMMAPLEPGVRAFISGLFN